MKSGFPKFSLKLCLEVLPWLFLILRAPTRYSKAPSTASLQLQMVTGSTPSPSSRGE